MRRWILRPLSWLFGAVLLLTFLLAAAIRLDQYILRWRAERLQADIRSLELRKTTYADVRRVIDRWWSVAQLGPCQSYWCDLELDIENMGYRHALLFLNRPWALSIYRRLGGRPASVFSTIRFREGVVWEKGITMHVESNSIEYEGKPFHYRLIGNVGPGHLSAISAEHPDYQIFIGGGCTGCQAPLSSLPRSRTRKMFPGLQMSTLSASPAGNRAHRRVRSFRALGLRFKKEKKRKQETRILTFARPP